VATINSNAYVKAIHALEPSLQIFSRACPLFAPLVEEGWWDHEVTRLTAAEYLKPILAENINSLVLGCTHYPLLKPLLSDLVGSEVRLVDSSEAMAQMTARLLERRAILNPGCNDPGYSFCVTDVPLRFRHLGESFLGRPMANVEVVKL
jgi:glutamate racemase